MSALDEIFDGIDEEWEVIEGATVDAARAELTALRATIAEQARQLSEARKTLSSVFDIASNELRVGNEGMWYSIEAESRAWFAANAAERDETTVLEQADAIISTASPATRKHIDEARKLNAFLDAMLAAGYRQDQNGAWIE
jgi:hypothetical protein